MANLGAYQKITRVLPGKPFGDARDGNLTISSDTTQSLTVQSCSGSSGQKSLTIDSGAFSNGDVVLIHQSRGTGVGQWEINKVASGGGSTTLTMAENLYYTYTDSGASQAQVIKIPMYNNVIVNSGKTWSATDWNQNINGFLIFGAKSTTITGSVSATGKGYVMGTGGSDVGQPYCGEGTTKAPTYQVNSGCTGGGGKNDSSGGGGGHGTAGANGSVSAGGSTGGSSDLLSLIFGGGGGGGKSGNGGGNGGDSGGIVMIFSKEITITGAITSFLF